MKATLFTNFCATAIVGTWVVLLKGYSRGLSSTCPKPFARSIFLRTEAHWPTLASQSEALELKLRFLLLDNIFYKPLHAHVNIKITNFLFLPIFKFCTTNQLFKYFRDRTSFHLSTLKATYVKTSKPSLCKQKEFVYGLKIKH